MAKVVNYSEPFVSFKDFRWACGHVGPAVCKKCWDAKLAEVNSLRSAIEAVMPYHAPLPRAVMNKLHQALQTKDTNNG